MDRLLSYVRAYQTADSLSFRLQMGEAIVGAILPHLKMFVARRCAPSSVDDAIQETLVSLVKELPSMRADSIELFWSFVYRIARWRIADEGRKEGRHPTISLDLDFIQRAVEASAASEPISRTERVDLEEAIAVFGKFNRPCFDYVWAYVIEDLSYKAIAAERGIQPDAARMRVQRCLEKLRQHLKKGL